MKLFLYLDGSALQNPGPGGAAYVIQDEEGRVIQEGWESFKRITNNEAEYRALIMALKAAKGLEAEEVVLLTDSELLHHQLLGHYRVKAPHLIPLFEEMKSLLPSHWELKKIKREENRRADQLAHMAAKRREKQGEAHHRKTVGGIPQPL